MTAINLFRVDDAKSMARFYKLDLQPTLFGEWSLVREWGRIGRAGTVKVEIHPTRGNADMAFIAKWSETEARVLVGRVVFAIFRLHGGLCGS